MIAKQDASVPAIVGELRLPDLISREGAHAEERFLEFFTTNIRNKNTRLAYARAVGSFLSWCGKKRLTLTTIRPIHVAAYVESLAETHSKPSIKQHLAAIRMCFDYLVTGHVIEVNPASSVRGPKYVIKRGKTQKAPTKTRHPYPCKWS